MVHSAAGGVGGALHNPRRHHSCEGPHELPRIMQITTFAAIRSSPRKRTDLGRHRSFPREKITSQLMCVGRGFGKREHR